MPHSITLHSRTVEDEIGGGDSSLNGGGGAFNDPIQPTENILDRSQEGITTHYGPLHSFHLIGTPPQQIQAVEKEGESEKESQEGETGEELSRNLLSKRNRQQFHS